MTRLALTLAAAIAVVGPTSADAELGLQGVDLQGVDLQGVDLQGVDLQGVDLQGIDLQGIDLESIDFRGTVLAASADATAVELTVFVGSHRDTLIWAIIEADKTRVVTYDPRRGSRVSESARVPKWFEFMVPVEGQRRGLKLRLTELGSDPSHNSMGRGYSSNSDVMLYKLQGQKTDGNWANVCPNDADVVAIPGSWTDGAYSPTGISFSCSGIGVAAKCVQQWGYKPWKTRFYGAKEVEFGPLFQACTRAAMADYCGDGASHTKPLTAVDIFDFYGFNSPASEQDVAAFGASIGQPYLTMILESVFGEAGTMAHHHERWMQLGAGSLPLECSNMSVPWEPDQEAMWATIVADLLPWQSADQYGMEWPLIGVRSHPQYWQDANLEFPDLNAGLTCPSEVAVCQ